MRVEHTAYRGTVWCLTVQTGAFVVRRNGKVSITGNCFPKSLDVSKAIDALHGAERGEERPHPTNQCAGGQWCKCGEGERGSALGTTKHPAYTAPATPDAQRYAGHGTALKTLEPWILVRKPLSESSIARNVLRWGTGALNIDGCRLPYAGAADTWDVPQPDTVRHRPCGLGIGDDSRAESLRSRAEDQAGRWPSALIASDLDVEGPAAGVRVIGEGRYGLAPDAKVVPGNDRSKSGTTYMIGVDNCDRAGVGREDLDGILGPYTRHFRIPGTDGEHDDAIPPEVETLIICAKASTAEREEGLDDFAARCGWTDGRAVEIDNPRLRMGKRRRNVHPTVKPVALMRHLVRLVTPPGGTCLDPFTGSGSTGVAAVWEGRGFVGCELTDTEAEPFVRIAQARIAYAERTPPPELRCRAPKPEVDERQIDLFAETGT